MKASCTCGHGILLLHTMQIAVAAPVAANLSAIQPLVPYCNPFYGGWRSYPMQMLNIVGQMPQSSEREVYEVNSIGPPRGPYNLPARYVESGCWLFFSVMILRK